MPERMFILAPEVLFAARVNEPLAVTYPVSSVAFDTVTTGASGSIDAGMTLLLGTTAGADDLGRQRIKTADATTISVGRSSQGTEDGELTITDNAYITVLNDYRVWAKIPYTESDGDVWKDGDIGPIDNAYTPPPIANAGPGFCGTIDAVTGVITVTLSATESREFASGGTGISIPTDYLWQVDGTITSGTITSNTITVTFTPGFYWVWLSVTGSNGKSAKHRIPIYARDPDNDTSISNFEIVNQRITPQGQEISVRVLDDIPASTYPDGTLVMIWNDEPSGPTDRTHMQFIGWHQRDEGGTVSLREGVTRDTVLHLVDVAGRLKTLPGFSLVLESLAIADRWTETVHGNIFYFIWYVLHWHSTALLVADLIVGDSGLNTFEFAVKDSDADTLYNQAHNLAQAVTPDRHLNCTRRGQLLLVRDPQLQFVGDRSLLTDWTISRDEWTELRFTYQRPPRVYKLLAYAVENGTTTPLAAMAPGTAEGQGAGYIETSERIAGSQFQLNYTEGNRYARMNARFGPVTVTIPITALPDDYEPAEMGWVAIGMNSAEAAQRGHNLSGKRGIVTEINIQRTTTPTGTTGMATVTWEKETSGPEAITYVPPS